jgi:glycosyltransferase involved in cell wall biosynthesis
MKKTLILVPDLRGSGGVVNYYNTLRLDADKSITYFPVNNAAPQGALAASLRLGIKYCKFLFNLIAKRYDVVVVNPSLDMGRSFHRDLVFIIISRILNRKTIVFFRGWFEPYEFKIKNSKWKLFLFKISYAKASKYVVLGNIFKRKLIDLGVPEKTPFFIETTVADSSYVNELNLREKIKSFQEEIKILFLSRIEKEKGIYIAIDAFRDFLKRHPDRKASLIIAGDGPDLAAVRKYSDSLNIPEIIFLGHVDRDEKKKVLLESHLMIFPSFTEGLPNSILEGMLYGMPIIARATGGIPEVVHNNVNGFVTESYESSVFLDFLSAITTDEKLYKTMVENNHKAASEKFTSEKVRDRIIKIL